ncbi:hypothetical protein KDD93_01770 [Campylobacter sp. faydin G-24]|uniref:Uncharacterized protein n=1 Tax=Campylobacter anatolicus TaxID=2829105 RepID=A0ABS5HGA4_9BACT|nr:hypothetical protein [Campylobacter anatolicus]MBR8463298.1 hypothetical protein [Campylobacter anatolicus]
MVCKDKVYSWGLFFKPQTNSFLISSCTFSFLNFAFKNTNELTALVKNNNQSALKFDKSFGFLEFKKDENLTFLKQSIKEWNDHKNTKLMQRVAKISQEFDIRILI